jgi:elongation factor G
VHANVGKPRVAYRETVRTAARGEGRFVRQIGGRGQYGHVCLVLEPQAEPAEGRTAAITLTAGAENCEFVVALPDGAIPREYLPAIEQGAREALQNGPRAGYPLIGVRVSLVDGSFHPVDSSDLAFKAAASMAVKAALAKARSAILEPVMDVEVVTPEQYMGDVVGDLTRRRGMITSMDENPNGKIVRAAVPASEMFGYATSLRSTTQGRATHTMEFFRYQMVPDGIAEGIVRKA